MVRKKKVSIIVPSLRLCGPNNQLMLMVRALRDSDADLIIGVISGKSINGPYVNSLEKLGTEIKFGSSLIPLLFRKGYLITQGLLPDIISALCFWRKTANFVRNVAWIDYPMKFGGFKGYLMALCHVLAIYRIGVNIAVSNSIKSAYSPIGFRMKVIHNSVEIINEGATEVAEEFKMDCVTIGSLIERKGILELSDFFQSGKINMNLVVYGEGPYKAMLQKNEHTILKGFTNTFRKELHKYAFFISNSRSEGYPNAVLEAAVSGLPLLLSDIGPHREIAENYRYTVLFKSVEDIPSAILELEKITMMTSRNQLKSEAISAFGFDAYKDRIDNLLNV